MDSIINFVNLDFVDPKKFSETLKRLANQRGISLEVLPENSWQKPQNNNEIGNALNNAKQELIKNARRGQSILALVVIEYKRSSYLEVKYQEDLKHNLMT